MNDTTNAAPSERPRAYSYRRFSSVAQEKGDSLRRQADLAQDYAQRHNLELDDKLTFEDLAVSAFRGANAAIGKLAEFLEAVRCGAVAPDSYLLVESLDRISRNDAFDAQGLLSDIIRAGVRVVTLLDEKVYSLEAMRANPFDMIYSILLFTRANEESATKSRRIKAAWGNKRAQAANKPLTSRAPAWLRMKADKSGFELIPDRAALVQRIFRMALEGAGQHRIAETFNREGIAPWGKAKFWHRSYIVKVLHNPAVVGTVSLGHVEHEAGKPRRKVLEQVEGYFPPVVTAEQFAEVQAMGSVAGRAPRGVQALQPTTNILSRLAVCPKCGRTMTRVQKGKKSLPSLVCSAAKVRAGCEYKSVRYQWIEEAVLRALPERLRHQDAASGDEELEREIANADVLVDHLKEVARNLLDSLGLEPSRALAGRLAEVERQIDDAERELRDLLERREIISGKMIGARIEKALAALQPTEGPMVPADANRALRSIFSKAVINWPEGTIELHWTHGGVCEVPYAFSRTAPVGLAGPGEDDGEPLELELA